MECKYINWRQLHHYTVRELNEVIADGYLCIVDRDVKNTRVIAARSVKGQLQVQSLSTGEWIDA